MGVATLPKSRRRAATRGRRSPDRFAHLRAPLLTAAIAGAIAWLAFDNGTYGIVSRSAFAILVWWAIVVTAALALTDLARLPRAALAATGLLAALAALSLASVQWAPSAETAVLEFNRVVLYLGVFVVTVLASTRAKAVRWSDGIAIGITLTGLLALASRLLPGEFPTSDAFRFLPSGQTRLSYPIGYWNALAELLAIGIPLLLRAAVATRGSVVRGVAVAPLPALAAALYLTSSRGGTVAAAAAVFLFLVLTASRFAAASAIAVAGAGSAVSVAALVSRPELVNEVVVNDVIERQARSAALVILAACIATGVVYGVGSRLLRPRLSLGSRADAALLAAVLVSALAALVALDPSERVRDFRTAPAPSSRPTTDYVREHLLSGSGNGRWQLWSAAVDEFRANPLVGGGAGSFQTWWERHREVPLFVRDAHSLYAEMLAELGVAGFLLVLGLVAIGLGAGTTRALRSSGDERVTRAALTAALAAFWLAAAVDWTWEVTVVTVVGMVLLGLLTGRATALRPRREPAGGGRIPFLPVRAAIVALGLVMIVAQALPMLAELRLQASHDAAARGDVAAATQHATAAKRLQPWAASPYLQLALVEERSGRLRVARSWMAEAIERDGSNWQLWLVAARIETKDGAIRAARRSLNRARSLNPLWARSAREPASG